MHFVYHPNHEPVIVPPEEYQKYLDNGWYDSPAKFPALEKDTQDVQEAPPEQAPRKKGRPPKAKAEELPKASVS